MDDGARPATCWNSPGSSAVTSPRSNNATITTFTFLGSMSEPVRTNVSKKFKEIKLSDAETLFKLYEMETQNLISQIL